MNAEMKWEKLCAGTQLCQPEAHYVYQIWKVRNIIDNGEAVITYHVVKLTQTDWLHLASADTFAEAKGIAQSDYTSSAP